MTFTVRDAGSSREITRGTARVAGVDRRLRNVQVMDGGILRTVATFVDPLAVSVSPIIAAGASASTTITTATCSSTVTGGVAPYTYAWTLVSSGGASPSFANSPSMASTTFTKTNVPPDTLISDEWLLTVTDSEGATATASTAARFFNTSSIA